MCCAHLMWQKYFLAREVSVAVLDAVVLQTQASSNPEPKGQQAGTALVLQSTCASLHLISVQGLD